LHDTQLGVKKDKNELKVRIDYVRQNVSTDFITVVFYDLELSTDEQTEQISLQRTGVEAQSRDGGFRQVDQDAAHHEPERRREHGHRRARGPLRE
jgi:hypothetical protein